MPPVAGSPGAAGSPGRSGGMQDLPHSIPWGAVWTSFTLSLRNLCRIRRLLIMMVLFLMPVILLLVFRTVAMPGLAREMEHDPQALSREAMRSEFISIFWLIANFAAPLTILLFASGMIRDEQEEQTLTYLLVRPIPRWAIYISKLLAAILVAWLLTVFGLAVALLTLWFGNDLPPAATTLNRFLAMAPTFGLLIAANGALFGLLSIAFRRSLILGAVYIVVFEGVLANTPFVLRKLTAMHYFQCIIRQQIGDSYLQWGRTGDPVFLWSIVDEVIPEMQECIITLVSIFIVAAALGMYFFAIREFRMKTPEGN
jgi:ABC-2 type transport system permease protein